MTDQAVNGLDKSQTAVHAWCMLLLSLFPGADLLGRGFEAEGFCVVRGPDVVWGSDVRTFHPTPGRFDGVIGGSPCQEFSTLLRTDPTGYGLEMLGHFVRCVDEARPSWFLLENVPGVPSIAPAGYHVQRFNVAATEFGGRQRRLRCFQFGSLDGIGLVIERGAPGRGSAPAALATEAQRSTRRGWADFCELQGLPRDFDLPGLSIAAKYRAVGNGVPVFVACVIARAIRSRSTSQIPLCVCGCGRPVHGRQIAATAGCRKRMERRRRAA